MGILLMAALLATITTCGLYALDTRPAKQPKHRATR